MGALSYYSGDSKYYQAARKAMKFIANSRSSIGLTGQDIDIEKGIWLDSVSHVGACIDSYYEYLYKGWLLFGDSLLLDIWETSIPPVHKYLAFETDSLLWYGKSNRVSGEPMSSEVTLWDAYWPAVLVLSGDTARAEKTQQTWNLLWNKHSLEPMVYNFRNDQIINPRYYLNPEIIESAWYLYYFTGKEKFRQMAAAYFMDIYRYCRTDIAYTHIEDVVTKKQGDQLSTFFFAETMKYLYLAFTDTPLVNPNTFVFNTEAHPFRKSNFDKDLTRIRLGF
jgi:hypothetical protein